MIGVANPASGLIEAIERLGEVPGLVPGILVAAAVCMAAIAIVRWALG